MGKGLNNNKLIKTGTKILFFVLIIVAYTALTVFLKTQLNDYVVADRRIRAEVDYADGSSAEFTDLSIGNVSRGDTVTVYVNLPDNVMVHDGTLVFGVDNAVTEVFYHDVLLDSYGKELDESGRMIGGYVLHTDVPDSIWGDELKIVMHPTEKNAFSDLSHVLIYKRSTAVLSALCFAPTDFLVAVAIFIFSIIGLFVFIAGLIRRQGVMRGLWLSIAAFLISLWMTCNHSFYSVFGFSGYFWECAEYVCGFTLGIPLVLFFRSTADAGSVWKKVFGIEAAVLGAFAFIATVLNFTGLVHYHRLTDIMYMLLIAVGISIAVHIFTLKENETRAVLKDGVAFFVFCCLVRIVLLLLFHISFVSYFFIALDSLMSLGILVLCAYLLIYFVKDSIERNRQMVLANARAEEMETKAELNRLKASINQMGPHFLYNVLASLQELVFIDPEKTSDLIGDFTVHLRSMIRAMSNDDLIGFSEEIRNIKAYVNIENIRFEGKLEVKYDLQATDFRIAPISIQPLVENAVKHGLYEKIPKGGCVTIRSSETPESWIISVEDDGTGFDYDKVMSEIESGQRKSVALKNLSFRLDKLMGASLKIDSSPGKGTCATVVIPKTR